MNTVPIFSPEYTDYVAYANILICRGDSFRTILTRIGELRSILPEGVPIMALTATATKDLRRSVMATISMQSPHVIAINPCKSNLMYTVLSFESIERSFRPIVERLRKERIHMPRILIYGRSVLISTCILKESCEWSLLSQRVPQIWLIFG